jgi:glycosyltransferase involved in cell wall biosynthesis
MNNQSVMKRLAIITTHPIQYNAPLFALLHQRKIIGIKVFYTWGESVLQKKYDPGFGKVIEWDIPLLDGYPVEFLENISEYKGSSHFRGIDNPFIVDSIEKFEPDAILVYGWPFKSHLKVMRYFKGKLPVLFRGDSTLLDEAGFFANLRRRLLLKWVYRHIDVALYTGKSNYQYFRKVGLCEKQLVFVPHAVDNDRFQSLTDDDKKYADKLRTRFKILAEGLVLLFAGKMEPKKDPGILLEAFSRCHFDKNVHLVMTGTGILLPGLQEKYGNLQNIHFTDFQNQSQMPAVYEIADVFVLPSIGPGETWGLSVNEAMANGKVIVASDKCGCSADLVQPGRNGYIFKAGDLEDLINKLKKVVENKTGLYLMKEASRDIISNYTLVKVAESIERIINPKNATCGGVSIE